MTFARYKGIDKNSGFTTGKVYLARTELGNDVVDYSSIDVINDDGAFVKIRANMDNGVEGYFDFEFLDEVYAVCRGCGDFKKGTVVVLDDADSYTLAGKRVVLYNVKGFGVRSDFLFTILDKTNIFPGVMLREIATGIWCRVRMVDECLWVTTECSDIRQSPEAFHVSIDGDGDIQIEPWFECIDNVNGKIGGLTEEKTYLVIREEDFTGDDHLMVVVNDYGKEVAYSSKRFVL